MKWLFVLLFFFCYSPVFSQDTLFSVRYPEGIITDSIYLKRKKYYILPINNPTRITIIPQKTLSEIHYSNGEIFVNEKMSPNDYFFLNTNPLTGDIEYKTELNSFENKLDLNLNLTDSLNSSNVIFHSIYRSQDSALYQGRFRTKFDRDLHITYFKLRLEKINGKLTICVNDLKSCKTESIRYKWDIMDTIKSDKYKPVFNLSEIYSDAQPLTNKFTYWDIINVNIENTLLSTKAIATQSYYEQLKTQPKEIIKPEKFFYLDGLTGYGNYSRLIKKSKEVKNYNLLSIGLRYGVDWTFKRKTNNDFGLAINMVTMEFFIGDHDPVFSLTLGEIGPTFTSKINEKSKIKIVANIGLTAYFLIEEFEPNGIGGLKSNLEFKYQYQKFVIGLQGSYRYPQGMFGTSLLIGYSFN